MEKIKEFRVIVYDAFFRDYIWNTEALFETKVQATEYAVALCEMEDSYTEEVQLYVRGLGMGEWCMFGYIDVDENGELYVEECFC